MAFEDSAIVRSAIRVEGFRDYEFDYQLIRAMGVADYGGSTVGECLATAAEITDGSPRSWSKAFRELAERVQGYADDCLRRGHVQSGRDHLLRASTYYRTAEYYTSVDPGALGEASSRCFARVAVLADPPIEVVRIPYGDGELPGYLVRPEGGDIAVGAGPRPTLVGIGGFDSSAEELYFHYGAPGAERGWNVLVFDGPGQPGCMRDNPSLTFRADYEVPIAAVLDAVTARTDVDAERVALAGQSFGGYFAARSAATDSRVRALVCNPPVVDMSRFMEAWIGSEVFHMSRDIRPEDVTGVPEDLMPAQMQWGIEAICRRFGVRSFHEWRDVMATYHLGDLLGAIECPVLAMVGESEGPEPLTQFGEFVAGVAGPVSEHRFSVNQGASAHSQADNIRLSAQVTFDWLDELFAPS